MNFCWTTLRVRNLESSLQFYHEILGLPVSSRHGGNGTEIVMLGEDDKPKIELLYDGNSRAANPNANISIGFAVDSLEKTMELLKSKQISVVRGPIAPNPHVRFVFVHDPDGVEVQLVESR